MVKWVVPGYTDFFTGVSADCRAGLTVPATGLQIRVRVRCEGYVHSFPTDGPWWAIQYQDCDTDCQFVEVEYSEDGGTTWTTTPPESAAGITWSIYCSGDEPQPDAQHSPQRCAAITTLNAEQCAAAGGEPCQQECQDCALPCGPEPTEWRLIDRYTGIVWFAGYVVPNPLYTGEGEAFCYDPCDKNYPSDPVSPQLLLEHFPIVHYCHYTPAGWPTTEGTWLHLEVLGCDGAQWTPVAKWCGCHQDIGHYWPIGDWPNQIDPCFISDYFWRDVGEPLRGNGGVYSTGGILLQSPPGCACLRDPATGEMVGQTETGTTYERFCCPTCNRYLGATGCSTGLEYLGHGEAVRFTGAVDNEGSNLWNWEDANGDSPAGSWPTGDITIAGELRSWRGPTAGGTGGGYHPNLASLSFSSVTLEPGAVLAISLTTETLTADDAKIEELMLDGGGVPKACANGGEYAVGITVTGTATFKNGAETYVTGAFSNQSAPHAGITGNCVFESGSKNFGTIAGNCDFSDNASNEGTITGDCTFADTAENNDTITGNCEFSGDAVNAGTITGDATFSGNAVNAGTVTGNATFIGDSVNNGTITGDATFSGNAVNAGTVTGNCTFEDNATNNDTITGNCEFSGDAVNNGTITGDATFSGNGANTGTVDGNATFANAAYTSDPTAGGVITGTITFSAATPVAFVLSGSSVWSADASAWVFTTSGQNWTFNGSSSNTGTVDGDATFNGSSSNSGTVTGDATFGDTASMAGNVTGTATFTDDACWSSGTAGAFDPDPPPAC